MTRHASRTASSIVRNDGLGSDLDEAPEGHADADDVAQPREGLHIAPVPGHNAVVGVAQQEAV
jgi:hypothetical protein